MIPLEAERIAKALSYEDWAKQNHDTKVNGQDAEAAGLAHTKEHLIPFDEIKLDSASAYLVKGLLPRTGLTVIWGPPKCGKSFWTYDTAMHIVLGWKYHGRRVKQGAVVYCALEGAEGFRARIEAFRQAKMAEDATKVPFYLIASPLSLVADCDALITSIRAALDQTVPAAVVIDTLNRSIAGSESDDRDMALYIQAADAIRVTFIFICERRSKFFRSRAPLAMAARDEKTHPRETAKLFAGPNGWRRHQDR
jgi:RecA-family ATPase